MKTAPKRFSWWPWLAVPALTLLAYWPALSAGFIWDDDAHVTKPALQSLAGLGRIWFELGATQQYYPVLHSLFWLEHGLWGNNPFGYHLTNVLLHGLAACLLARTLLAAGCFGREDKSPARAGQAAWGAALLFAVHPVGVESVAWISEQKNTLSLVFYFCAALAYLRFDRDRRVNWYLAGLGLFLLALLSKSVTATLPCALGLMLWLRRGRLEWKRDILPLVPWLATGLASGFFSAWIEKTYIGASGADFDLGLLARGLLAGRIAWFYLGKLIWPASLVFTYPRWTVNAGEFAQWLYPLGILAVTAALWAVRRHSRGPLVAWLFFLGSLVPALGFVNVYPFIFSYVADHFQYLASLGIFALAAGIGVRLTYSLPLPARMMSGVLALAVVLLLAILTWAQCVSYRDARTLYSVTLERNPDSWLAHLNLGNILLEDGKADDAIAHYRRAEALEPTYPSTHFNLGWILLASGNAREAADEFRLTLRYAPKDTVAMNNLGMALAQTGDLVGAESILVEAIRLAPGYVKAHASLGGVLAGEGAYRRAIVEDEAALALDSSQDSVELNLARAFHALGREEEAQSHLAAANRLRAGQR